MSGIGHRYRKWLVFFASLVFIVALVVYFQGDDNDINDMIAPNNTYDKTLVVVADKDFEPYSFLNEDGEAVGHDVEMIYYIAQELGVNVDLRLMDWNEAVNSVREGRTDLLLGLEYTPNEFADMILSVPLHNDPFVVFSKKKFTNVSEFYDKKIGVLNNSGSYTLFVKPHLLEKKAVLYDSYSEVFDALENNEVEYAIARYSVGRRAVARLENSSIKASGPALASNDCCVATSLGNEELMKDINQAITKLRVDGSFEKIKVKWLGRYVEIIDMRDFVQIYKDVIIFVGAGIFMIIALGFVYNYRKGLSVYKKREHELLERAVRDSMTQLYTKNATQDMVKEILKESNSDSRHVFIVVDIDDFKWVNDNLGHDFGDAAILEFISGIKSVFSLPDIIGRIGGDEFAVFVKDIPSEAAVIKQVDKLVVALKRKVIMGNKSYKLSGSVGIAFYPSGGSDFAEIYKHADEALYMAKKNGKGRHEIYLSKKN